MSSAKSVTNVALLQLLVLLSPWSFASFVAETSSVVTASTESKSNQKSPYKIIFDGGSTGSRLHIFEFVEVEDDNDENDRGDGFEGTIPLPLPSPSSAKVRCVRRGSSRADIPLSAFGRVPSDQNSNTPLDPTDVATHLLPLFDFAATIIPSEYYETTGVYYQATAGMRLLEESEQDAVYDAVYEGLIRSESFVFRGIRRTDIATLSGEMEAYYGALAANFLQGIIDTELRVVSAQNTNNNLEGNENEAPDHDHPVGALDMGGSSTQIVYIANLEEDATELPTTTTTTTTTCPIKQQPQPLTNPGNGEPIQNTCRLSNEHFFSTSYLSYGVDEIRKRLWGTLVAECKASSPKTETNCEETRIVSNPCANKGFEVEFKGYTLVGSGNTNDCSRQMKRLIPHPDIVHDWDAGVDEWIVGGVEHPPIRGKFLAMSLYFFAMDSLRVFSKPDASAHEALDETWPNPSIAELQNALDGLCSRDWHGDMELQEGTHPFTRKEVLPHRCLETVYMVTLLKDGFGFHPSSRDITFTFLIDGDEVEWTLGLALAMNANEQTNGTGTGTAATTTVTTTTYDYGYNINETGNLNDVYDVFEEEEQEEYNHSSIDMHFFGVTSPPTHCC